MDYIKLANGVELPTIGFGPGECGYSPKYNSNRHGVWSIPRRAYNKFVRRQLQKRQYIVAIASAIQQGFHLIDYSAAYGDGNLIHRGIQLSGLSRDKLTLTTRVSNRAQFQGKEAVKEEFFLQLKGMQIDYIDILMFHWPVTDFYETTWQAMVELYQEGYVKTLGVANCHKHHLEKLFTLTEERPLINQFEIHPLFTQKKLIDYCKKNGIQSEAYTPIARFDDRLVRLPVLHRIANKHHKSILQVILRWHVQNHIIPIVRTLNKQHQKENFDIYDFSLSDAEIADIDNININARVRYDPDNCDFTIL
ncbi:aldo/keto reductase [Pectinatus sottacetonis]|uniref:aldo/keto reductase n=1 Tax=Pectinatus sottacetonis TaxID=1002795 RepID=UPI0018C5C848|nr:aldo/keto reductase [Pectinatus sottacetonis]